MQHARALAVAGLVVLGLGPVCLLAGQYAPLAGLLALALFLLARLLPAPSGGDERIMAVLETVRAAAVAGVLSRGIGEYLVPGYPMLAGVLAVALLGVAVLADTRLPRALVWFGIVFGVIAVVLFLGAGLGIAPPKWTSVATNPVMLIPAGLVLLALAAPAPLTRHTEQRSWRPVIAALAAVLGFGALAVVTLHQLGGSRAGVSPVPILDALRVAEAAEFVPVLVIAAVLVFALAAHEQLRCAVAESPNQRWWPPLLACAAVTVLGVFPGLVVCAVIVLACFTYRGWAARGGELR